MRIIALGLAGTLCAWASNETVFKSKLEPLLLTHCSGCHNEKSAQSNLTVTKLAALIKGGRRGPAVTPGHSGASLLMKYVRGEMAPRMPLGGKLGEAEIAAMAAAIDEMKAEGGGNAANPHLTWLLKAPAAGARGSIDEFIQARLREKGLSPAPPASKRALLRRVYFDLIGLPPTPEEARGFLDDASEDAYPKLVDRLLADPRYGERWGRHWLDLARFAESDGFAIDGERPTAWRYRDYVIRSFNTDKPYDQFVKEQLAGDEIGAGGRGAPNEGLVALGFLRMGPWEADANFDTQLRQDFLNEVTSTTAQVFLGLTVGCARCHDHKYDPISTRDHYRMQAFFASTRIDDRPAPFVDTEQPAAMRRLMRRYEDELDAANEELKAFEKELKKGFENDAAFQKAANDKKNTDIKDADRKRLNELREKTRRIATQIARYQPVAYAVSEVVPPHVPEIAPTHVLIGGELAVKGEKVEPGFLSAVLGREEPAQIPFVGRYRSGRRKALAEWIAGPANPLTARVMVNRIWQHHFGEGLVRTPSDLGINGDRPSHPELLDFLAAKFVEQKWSVKSMHRMMLVSSTYKQATNHPELERHAVADPDNRLLWRANWQRLESEVIRDSILAISGRLNAKAGGPGMFFGIGDDVAQGFEFFKWYPSDEAEQRRRSVYAFQRRSLMMPMMEVFDAANMSETCSRRNVTTVPPQALTLLNGEFTTTEAAHFAGRVLEQAGTEPERQIHRAFQLALLRDATPAEISRARKLYQGRSPLAALTQLGAVLFNLNEFLYLE